MKVKRRADQELLSRMGGRLRRIFDGTVPLATRMRPLSLDEVAGQSTHRSRRRSAPLLERGLLSSMILSGPPGTQDDSLQRSSPV